MFKTSSFNRPSITLLSTAYGLMVTFTLLLFANPVHAESHDTLVNVTFEVNLKSKATLKPDQKIYISGSHQNLGYWQPNKTALKKVNEQRWQLVTQLPRDLVVEYKFTLGSWDNQAVDLNNNPLENFVYQVSSNDDVKHHQIESWTTKVKSIFKGQITGTVKYHPNIQGQGLKSRDIVVWLPPHYFQETDKTYPVLYMHDGQNVFDPKTANYGVDWQVDETASSLITQNKVKPFIVVAINNTTDRNDEYYPLAEKGQAYMAFLANEVKPFIDKTYRTKPEREYTAVAGSSMGGIISFGILWQYSEIFSKAICMSPAVKIENYDYTPYVIESAMPKRPFKLYLDNGGVGLEQRLQPGIDDMLALLKSKSVKSQQELYWFVDLPARHNEAAWAKRMPEAIQYIFND